MDTMYSKKAKANAKSNADASQRKNVSHISDNYKAAVKPRRNNAEVSSADANLKTNLKKINKEFVDKPAVRRSEYPAEIQRKNEDSGAKVVTKKSAVKKAPPIAAIVTGIIITAIVMYTLTLYVKIEEYNLSISKIESQISDLQAESVQLSSKLESKYDLNKIQKLATEEYGMVNADSLPKKYIKITREGDTGELLGDQDESQNGLSEFFQSFASAIRGLME